MTHPTRLALTAALALGALALPALPPLPAHPPTGQWRHRLSIGGSNRNVEVRREAVAANPDDESISTCKRHRLEQSDVSVLQTV